MPTKFYFQSVVRESVTPVFSNQWTGSTQGTRWNMYPEKGSSSVKNEVLITVGTAANTKTLDRQYISPPLMGSQIISGQCSGRLLVAESATNDNIDQVCIGLRLVSRNGQVNRISGTGLAVNHYGNNAEFSATGFRNKNFASGTNLTTITGQDGDRIVLEIGYGTSAGGTSPAAGGLWGDNLSDLPINELTVSGAGWFSMGNVNLNFYRNPTNITVS